MAHTAVCVPDVKAAVRWYAEVLGLRVLSPPYLMEGPQIEQDMGELVPSPVAVYAAILGFEQNDRVLEVIEYPNARGAAARPAPGLTETGLTHIGLLCDDIDQTRADLEGKGVRFLTAGVAGIAGLRTTWFVDPYGIVFILLQKGAPDRPYYRQFTG